ncbi:hypothetical protein QNI16_37780 [Cytophagaceae bacterium YF14B1]|uniref:Uncharacterized protein n=1 Tax=Xanthocytophaga flava TaxID=3048013 RepID=A0AAE3QVN6_9BACT|nr:hypothetical protein [Xanthocytophaga flavus]MDJ1486292.1 hypothetical protein [Xanthocytophaga flavus]
MKTFLTVFFSLALICSLPIYAQKEALHWYFGPKLGFDFTNGSPKVLQNSAMTTSRGCAVISNKSTGELLFYSNGRNTWNRFHQKMPSSNLFPDDCSNPIVQSVLIVPVPGSEYEYYLFTLEVITSEQVDPTLNCLYGDLSEAPTNSGTYYFNLSYSIIDMRLDGGKGDIRQSENNISLQQNLSTKLTAIPHKNGKDYWLITHQASGDAFSVYLINESGIQPPSQQQIGSSYQILSTSSGTYFEVLGELKASPDGKNLPVQFIIFVQDRLISSILMPM